MSHNPSDRYATPVEIAALAAEIDRVIDRPATERTGAIARFILAAEITGISRRDVENMVRDALKAAQ
jgi:hypothetical protein